MPIDADARLWCLKQPHLDHYKAIAMMEERERIAADVATESAIPGLHLLMCKLRLAWQQNNIKKARRINRKIEKLKADFLASANAYSATQGAGKGVSC